VRILFDHNVPKKLRSLLPGHYVITSREMGWDILKNGDLMTVAEDNGFEAMVTGDKGISHQQNLKGRGLTLVVLPTTDWGTLRQNSAPIVTALDEATPGSLLNVVFDLPFRRPRRRSGPES